MNRACSKVKLTCNECGKNYLVYPSVITAMKKRGYKHNFCSKECKYEWNKRVEGPWKNKKMPFYPRPNKDIKGSKNPNWRGGVREDKDGYILVHSPEHPYRDSDGYVREHRLNIEQSLNRFLHPTEVVHHINGIKNDNNLENLRLFKSTSAHIKFHADERKKI